MPRTASLTRCQSCRVWQTSLMASKHIRGNDPAPEPKPREQGDGMAHHLPSRDVIQHVRHYLCECQPVLGFRSARTGLEFWIHKPVSDRLH